MFLRDGEKDAGIDCSVGIRPPAEGSQVASKFSIDGKKAGFRRLCKSDAHAIHANLRQRMHHQRAGLPFPDTLELRSVPFQPNSDKLALQLRRGFVALAWPRGVTDECQTKPESGIGGAGVFPVSRKWARNISLQNIEIGGYIRAC